MIKVVNVMNPGTGVLVLWRGEMIGEMLTFF